MKRYYTRVCNFYYGNESKLLLSKKKTLSLNGSIEISFDHIEIISRQSKKKISIQKINSLPKLLKKQVILDLKNITSKKKKIFKFKFSKFTKYHGSFKSYSR